MRAFGLEVGSDFSLPGDPGPATEDADLSLCAADAAAIDAAWSGESGPPIWETVIDGRPFALAAGRDGDHRMHWGGQPFHLNAPADVLLCAVPSPADPGWQRQLLDTVLHTTALIRGADAVHASAVEIDGRAVGIIALSGGGKTTLASELMRRGRPLVADDIVVIRRCDGGFMAEPGPPLMNLPAARLGAVDDVVPLTHIADLGDEVFVEVGGAVTEPLPLGALWLLERGEGIETSAERVPASPLPLVGHTLLLRSREDRDRHIFNLLGDVADAVPVFRLRADAAVGPEALADLIEGS